MEQRSYHRRSISVRAQVHDGVSQTDARIVNMTPMGMKVKTAFPPPQGAYVQVRVHDLAASGRVVWSSDSEFGLFVSGENPLFGELCALPANRTFNPASIASYGRAGLGMVRTLVDQTADYAPTLFGFCLLLGMVLSGLAKWAS